MPTIYENILEISDKMAVKEFTEKTVNLSDREYRIRSDFEIELLATESEYDKLKRYINNNFNGEEVVKDGYLQ